RTKRTARSSGDFTHLLSESSRGFDAERSAVGTAHPPVGRLCAGRASSGAGQGDRMVLIDDGRGADGRGGRAHRGPLLPALAHRGMAPGVKKRLQGAGADRKSTRLNSSHDQISYAVFCLKKKKKKKI